MLACREGYLNCVKVLVEGGADVKQKAQNGFNCLDFAIDNGHEWVNLIKSLFKWKYFT